MLALNSYENRVYQVAMEDGPPYVAKFYRPERWTNAQILEEHSFVRELAEREIPVVAPLAFAGGSTLSAFAGFRFAVYPNCSGRAPELGNRADMSQQLADFLSGYERFHEFDRRELHLVEALRALRLIHYAAWLARRWDDPAFPAAFPWFNTQRYWQDRILELREQIAAMDEPPLDP